MVIKLGYNHGFIDGYNHGFILGYNHGFIHGYNHGFILGYIHGYNNLVDTGGHTHLTINKFHYHIWLNHKDDSDWHIYFLHLYIHIVFLPLIITMVITCGITPGFYP